MSAVEILGGGGGI